MMFITPQKLIKEHPDIKESLHQLIMRSRDNRKCEICGQPVWKYGHTGMCFTCTTGETDDSQNYELIEV
jgi:hypothetical protein